MKKRAMATALAIMFLLSTKPVFANGSAPSPGGPDNENLLKCLLIPVPFNIPFCMNIG